MQHSISDQLCEQISAFLDGELPEKEIELLLRRFEREPQLKAILVRYAAAGESLRDETGPVSRGFSARLTAAVAQEKPHQQNGGGLQSRYLDALPQRRSVSVPQWLRTAGGLAGGVGIAATVAALAIFTIQTQHSPAPDTQLASVTPDTVVIGQSVDQKADNAGGFKSGEALSYTVPALATTRPLVNAARLTDYVLAHSEYSSPLGRRNVLSGIIAEDPTVIDAAGAAAMEHRAPQPEKQP